jgi:hypothetical protein
MANCSLIQVHHYFGNTGDQIKHYEFTGTHEDLNFRGSSIIQTTKKHMYKTIHTFFTPKYSDNKKHQKVHVHSRQQTK